MIIFDRFLCCINLKSFGKCIGWLGMVICVLLAYAIFLVLTGKKSLKAQSNFYDNEKFNHLHILFMILLLIAAIFHILLVCGIKFLKSLLIVPYLILTIVQTAAALCILPSQIDLENMSWYNLPICIITLILSIYFTLCIYSLYEIVKYQEKRRKFYQNPDTIYIAPMPKKFSV